MVDFDNLKSFAEMQAEQETQKPETTQVTEPEVTETAEEVAETEENTEEGEHAGETTEDTKPKADTPWGKSGKVPKGIAERFRKLTERDRIKDAKIRELETAMTKFIEASKPQQTREPTLQDFLEAGKTENDFINYLVEQRITQRSQIDAQRRDQERALERTKEEISKKWNESFAKAQSDLPDYDEVIASADVMLPNQIMRYITENDVGPYISYTIASNEELQSKIDSIQDPAGKHAIVLEVEKNIRSWLASRKTSAPNVQPKTAGNGKPKVPGSIKNGSRSNKPLDPATASIEEWLGI